MTARSESTHLGGSHRPPGREVGNEVSEAATTTAHAGRPAAQAAGFRNLG